MLAKIQSVYIILVFFFLATTLAQAQSQPRLGPVSGGNPIGAANPITIGDGRAASCTGVAVQQAIDGASKNDLLTFNCPANQVIKISQTIAVDKSITLDGAAVAGLTLDGQDAVRVMTVNQAGQRVTLKNLIIQNGKATGQGEAGAGGALLTTNQTTLIIDTVQFLNNQAAGLGGGAIYGGWRSNNTIHNSTFQGNQTDGDDGSAKGSERGGGAIAIASESKTTINNSIFRENSGTIGGAINTLLGDLTVLHSCFIKNSSLQNQRQGYGGAIYTDGASATTDTSTQGSIIIRGSRFEENMGRGQGGALFLFVYQGDEITVADSVIVQNRVKTNGAGNGLGGGLRIGNGIVTLSNLMLADNRADQQGGGLWIAGGQTTSVSMERLSFIRNRAVDNAGTGGLGGAAMLNITVPTTINQSTFSQNYAGFQGGAFWSGGMNVTISNSLFDQNDSGNPWNVKEQTGEQMKDGGNNYEWPELVNLGPQVFPVTAGNVYADPQLENWVDNEAKAPTHPQANNAAVTGSGAGANQVATPTNTPTATPSPTDTPTATNTRLPDDTPIPTTTSTSAATPSPTDVATPTLSPTTISLTPQAYLPLILR